MYRQVQRLVRRREGEFVHVRPSAKDRGDFRWKKTQDEARQEETLLKRVTTDVDKQRCALSLRLPGQHHQACTKVGLTQVEVTVPLSFLSLHCLSIIEQRQLNFPLGFHAFN